MLELSLVDLTSITGGREISTTTISRNSEYRNTQRKSSLERAAAAAKSLCNNQVKTFSYKKTVSGSASANVSVKKAEGGASGSGNSSEEMSVTCK